MNKQEWKPGWYANRLHAVSSSPSFSLCSFRFPLRYPENGKADWFLSALEKNPPLCKKCQRILSEVEKLRTEKRRAYEETKNIAIRAEAAAQEKRERNKNHLVKVNKDAAKSLMTGASISARQANIIVSLISKGEIPCVSIRY